MFHRRRRRGRHLDHGRDGARGDGDLESPHGDRNWGTAANWSTGVVPGLDDDVVADGNVSNNRIDVDLPIDVKSITTQNGYSRPISGSGANSIRVRGNVTLGGTGNFDCSTATTQIDGNLSLGTSVTFRGTAAP